MYLLTTLLGLSIHQGSFNKGEKINFAEIANARQSCRKYDKERVVEDEKLSAILESARLAPSACNGQPYHITVCRGETAKQLAPCVMGLGMNKFAKDVPVFLVISEESYVPSAALGAKLKRNDYRSIDIGILSAFITLEATAQGLGTCILGWFDDDKIQKAVGLDKPVRLVITLGYPSADDAQRQKKRKALDELVKDK